MSKTWAAATDPLVERLQSGRQFDFVLLRQTYGTRDQLQDSVTNLTFKATGDDFISRELMAMLRANEAAVFPVPNAETGYLGLLFADGGYLTNSVLPAQHPDLRFEFDCDAPTAGNGLITMTFGQLVRGLS